MREIKSNDNMRNDLDYFIVYTEKEGGFFKTWGEKKIVENYIEIKNYELNKYEEMKKDPKYNLVCLCKVIKSHDKAIEKINLRNHKN